MFIEIKLDEGWACSPEAQALVKQCPVEIFAWQAGRLAVIEAQEDECTLCELCLATAPPGALVIDKLYKEERLVSHGNSTSPRP